MSSGAVSPFPPAFSASRSPGRGVAAASAGRHTRAAAVPPPPATRQHGQHGKPRAVPSTSCSRHGMPYVPAALPSIRRPCSRPMLGACRATGQPSETFNLQLAVTLAGAAFESYNEPVADVLNVERTVNNTETTFVSREYMDMELAGRVTVHLHKAEGLPARDLWGTSDPYVTFSIGMSHARSKVVDRNLNPEWDETFTLYVRDPDEQKLLIRVFDKDTLKSDDPLGVAYLPASVLCSGEPRTFTLELSGDGGGGSITFSAEYFPFTDAELDSAQIEDASLQAVKGTPTEVLDAWNDLAKLVDGSLPLEQLQPICYVDNTDSDTQAWTLWNREARHVCVAFRGTEQSKLKDIVTDLKLVPCDFDVERTTGNFFNKNTSQVHAGFLQAYDSVKVKLLSIVDSVVKGEPEKWTVYVTGHSLGGALATLFALELETRWAHRDDAPHVTMYNYGSPRVGNSMFVEEYNRLVKDSWRVFNKNDIVSSVPRMGNYKHVHHPVVVSEEGSLELMGEHAINDVLGEGLHLQDVVPGLFRKGLDLEANEELKELVEQELVILASISSGQGILEHLEDFYLAVFQKIIVSVCESYEQSRSK